MKKYNRLILASLSTSTILQLGAVKVLAQTVPIEAPTTFTALGKITAGSLVSGLVQLGLIIAGLVFFFILVIGGIRWILSGGDKAGTETARNQITAALVGLVIVFSAYAIVQLIQTFFGTNILNFTLPTFVPR